MSPKIGRCLAEDGLLLEGLSGDNPLAFLAALGTLRTLATCWPDRWVRMAWVPTGGWRPMLVGSPRLSRQEVVPALHEALESRHRAPEFTLVASEDQEPKEIKMPSLEFAEVARLAATAATRQDRRWADFCAAFGAEAGSDEDPIQETDFHFTSGQQSFLGSIRELSGDASSPHQDAGSVRKSASSAKTSNGGATTADQLDCALFEPWLYSDPRPSMRWDPVDDRRYALRAFDPTNASASPIMTVRGANRLAIEALPWLPVIPRREKAVTRGFLRSNKVVSFRWPIWEPAISADTVRSLLGLDELYREKIPRFSLRARGVVEVFSSRRIGGYYRNFSPAVSCLGGTP